MGWLLLNPNRWLQDMWGFKMTSDHFGHEPYLVWADLGRNFGHEEPKKMARFGPRE